jgi:hypothetical protein
LQDEQTRAIARRISEGHAYEKHVVEGDDFPEIKSREVIFQVLTDPASLKRGLREGREAFWNRRRRVHVILDLLSEDCGTALRLTPGKAYFRGLR